MIREDFILRLIRQLAEAISRIAGLRRSGRHDEAISEAGAAWDELLGHPRTIVEVVDTPTLASLLREPARMRVAAQLLAEEARAHEAKGNPMHAASCYRYALELVLEARAIDPNDDDDAAILELSRHVPASDLDARYR
jgi:tetratricopeptide (TPR) repeat protein